MTGEEFKEKMDALVMQALDADVPAKAILSALNGAADTVLNLFGDEEDEST